MCSLNDIMKEYEEKTITKSDFMKLKSDVEILRDAMINICLEYNDFEVAYRLADKALKETIQTTKSL